MSYANFSLDAPGGLPDPDADPQFYSGVPAKRLFAFFVDVAIVWGISLVVVVLTFGLGILIFGLIVAAVDFAYRVLTIAGRSSTLGMRLVGIELRRGDGERFDFGHAVIHTILFYISIAFVIVQLISVVMMGGTRMGRGLHDLPFGSTAINSPE